MRTFHFSAGINGAEHRLLHVGEPNRPRAEHLNKAVTELNTTVEAQFKSNAEAQKHMAEVMARAQTLEKTAEAGQQIVVNGMQEYILKTATALALNPATSTEEILKIFAPTAVLQIAGTGAARTVTFVRFNGTLINPDRRDGRAEMNALLGTIPQSVRDLPEMKVFIDSFANLEGPLQLATVDILRSTVMDEANGKRFAALFQALIPISQPNRVILFRQHAEIRNALPAPPANAPRPEGSAIPQDVWDFVRGLDSQSYTMLTSLATASNTIQVTEQNVKQQEAERNNAEKRLREIVGTRDLATMTPEARDRIRGQVMMSTGASVEWNAAEGRFDVTAAGDTMSQMLNRLQGAMLMFGSFRAQLNQVRGKTNTATNRRTLPDNPTPIDISRINGANVLLGKGAVEDTTNPNKFTATAALGIPGQANTVMVYEFDLTTNRWKVTAPDPIGTRNISDIPPASAKLLTDMPVTGANAKVIRDNRAVWVDAIQQLGQLDSAFFQAAQKGMNEQLTVVNNNSTTVTASILSGAPGQAPALLLSPRGSDSISISTAQLTALRARFGADTVVMGAVRMSGPVSASYASVRINNMTPDRFTMAQQFLTELGEQDRKSITTLARARIAHADKVIQDSQAATGTPISAADRTDLDGRKKTLIDLLERQAPQPATLAQIVEARTALDTSLTTVRNHATEFRETIRTNRLLWGDQYGTHIGVNQNDGYKTKQHWNGFLGMGADYLYMKFDPAVSKWKLAAGLSTGRNDITNYVLPENFTSTNTNYTPHKNKFMEINNATTTAPGGIT